MHLHSFGQGTFLTPLVSLNAIEQLLKTTNSECEKGKKKYFHIIALS